LGVPVHLTTTSQQIHHAQDAEKGAAAVGDAALAAGGSPSATLLASSTAGPTSATNLAAGTTPAPILPSPAKNILYIIVDDLTADLTLFGGKVNQVPMPNLEGRLARRQLSTRLRPTLHLRTVAQFLFVRTTSRRNTVLHLPKELSGCVSERCVIASSLQKRGLSDLWVWQDLPRRGH